MNPAEQEIALYEFRRDRDTWTNASFDLLYYRNGQLDKVLDRQRSFILTLVGLSVAIGGLGAPIFLNTTIYTHIVPWTVYVLFAYSFIGIALSLDLMHHDKRSISKVHADEHLLFQKYLKATNKCINLALDKKLTQIDVHEYFSLRDSSDQAYLALASSSKLLDMLYQVYIYLFYFLLLIFTILIFL